MSAADLLATSLLDGRYRLVERLGAGGMAVVWRGFDEVLGRQVAVKVLSSTSSDDPGFRRRLRIEAQAAARLSHPHITNVYDYGESVGADGVPVPYVVMELVDGESLAVVLARLGTLPWPSAVRICAEVAAALAAAHARGIVHRDVAPANVMLTADGAKVVDFGISALVGENDIDEDGSLLGTPAYLAPERMEGGQVSPATDVYAVGLLLYRCLAGSLPWDAGTTTALIHAHQYTEPNPLPPIEGLPVAAAEVCRRSLTKQPSARPGSAELAKILALVAQRAPADPLPLITATDDANGDTTILPWRHDAADRISGGPAGGGAAGNGPPDNRLSENDGSGGDGSAGGAPVDGGVPASGPPAPGAVASGGRGDGPGGEAPVGGHDTDGGSRGRRRTAVLMTAAAAVVLAGAGAYAWRAFAPTDQGALNGAPPPASSACRVTYAVRADDGQNFQAAVTVTNRTKGELTDWWLRFQLPGDQQVSAAEPAVLEQDGRSVTAASVDPIRSGSSVVMQVNGKYRTSNALPASFVLNDSTCEVLRSAKPGEEPRPVGTLAPAGIDPQVGGKTAGDGSASTNGVPRNSGGNGSSGGKPSGQQGPAGPAGPQGPDGSRATPSADPPAEGTDSTDPTDRSLEKKLRKLRKKLGNSPSPTPPVSPSASPAAMAIAEVGVPTGHADILRE